MKKWLDQEIARAMKRMRDAVTVELKAYHNGRYRALQEVKERLK